MKKYESYKDSGIEWIGEIPSHWEVRKLKFVTKLYGGFPFKSEKFNQENGINVIRIGDIKNNIDLKKCVKSTEQNIFQITKIQKNDTLIALSGATTGKSCFIKNELQNSYINQRIAKFNYFNSFLYYCILSKKFQKDILLGADGSAQENISNTKIENMFIPFPPLPEQKQISSFLDEKVKKIEKAILKKEKLIKLLKEEKQVIINEAVTKGIDKNIEYKDSGVEWIGEIPKHWKVRKTTHIFNNIGSGTTPTSTNIKYYNNGTINWLQTGDLTDGYITKTSKKITIKALKDFSTLKLYPKNSIVIAMYGATIGKAGLLKIETTTNQACCVLSNSKLIISEYIFYFFISSKQNIISESYGGGQPNISQDIIKNLKIPLPPLSEQQKIVSYIEEKILKIDNLIQLQQKQIEKLKEYKTSLIDEVVTGKIKVYNEEGK